MVHLVSGNGRTTQAGGAPRLLIDTEDVAPGVTKINLRGRLDANAIQSISPMFDRMARTRTQLIVDLSRVTFIASTGLRILIGAGRGVASAGGRMAFLGPEPSVESVLITTGTDVVVPIFHDLASAIIAVAAGADDEDEWPAASLPFSLQADRGMRGVARVNAWVDELAILLNLSRRAEYALRLSLEEVVTNIVTHARPLPGVDAGKVSLRLVAEPAKLLVTVQDQCEEYNPLRTGPTQAAGAAPDSGGEGGLGIGLLRQHARDLTWSRVGPVNRLMLTIPR